MKEFKATTYRSFLPPLSKYTTLDLARQELFVLRNAGIVYCAIAEYDGKWYIERPAEVEVVPHIDFFWPMASGMLIDSQFGKMVVKPGEMLIAPSWFDRIICTCDVPCPYLYIRVDSPEKFPNCRMICTAASLRGNEMYNDFIRLAEAMKFPDAARQYLASLAGLIAAEFFEDICRIAQDDSFRGMVEAIIASPKNNGVTVPELARKMNMSESSLYKKCIAFCGKSPQQIISGYRLGQAQYCLRYTEHSLREIAEMTGYSDVFAFSKAFTKFAGVSPAEYRKHYTSPQKRTSKNSEK